MDLSPYSSKNRDFKLSRVFRDPSTVDGESSNSKFELWIAFEFKGGKLFDAQVLKTIGVNRPHNQVQTSSIDFQIAFGVAKEHPVHKTDREGILCFWDYFEEQNFDVESRDLFRILGERLAKISPKNVPKQRMKKETDSRGAKPDGQNPSTVDQRKGDGILSEIDEVLEQSYGFINNVRATTLDEPTHR